MLVLFDFGADPEGSAPAGALSVVLVALFLPSTSHDPSTSISERLRSKFSRNTLKRVDVLGAFLVLVASVLLVFALEEGGSSYPWNSAAVIVSLALSAIAWVTFVVWEIRLEKSHTLQEPIFPMRVLKNRVVAGMMA